MELIKEIGAFAGLAAFFGLALLALLSFTQGREIRRLREWAGSAPERDTERKESISASAAQRAEELRRMEEARVAERQAASLREERRRRRAAGLSEPRGVGSLLERLSDQGSRLGEPRYLVAFIVVLAIAGGAYLVLHGGSAGGTSHGGRAASAPVPSEIEVAVLNGTSVPGLAARYGSKVQRRGFKLGAVTNSTASSLESVVMFRRGARSEARLLARQLGFRQIRVMSPDVVSVSAGAPIAVIVGEENASPTH